MRSCRSHRRVSVVATVTHQRYYHQSEATEKNFFLRPSQRPQNRVGRYGGPRLPREDEIFVTWTRQGHHHQKGGSNLYPHEVEELACAPQGIRKGLQS